MDFLLNPNLAYLMLVAGISLAVLATLAPGTGLLELFALAFLLVAGWQVLNLPVNPWALALIAVGAIFFLFSLRRPRRLSYMLISFGLLVVGSIFVFGTEVWWKPAVNPVLAVLVSLLVGGFFWVAARKSIEADRMQPSHDLETLIGATGEAKTDIHEDGTVQVQGELWSAHSALHIPSGSKVRVASRNGFILEVEPVNSDSV